MKIVHYWPHLLAHESGPGSSILGWSRASKDLGMDVTIAVDRAATHLDPPEDVRIVQLDHRGRGHFRFPSGGGRVLRQTELLVVHAGWVLWNPVMAREARRHGVPYLVMAHGVYHPRVLGRRAVAKQLWLRAVERRYLDAGLGVHVFFPDEVVHLRRLGVSAPALVAPNGVSPPPDVTWDGGSGNYLLWLGRYDPENKGLDLLLQGLARLPPTDRPALRLHGRDWQGGRRATQQMAEDLELERWVAVGEPVYGPAKWELMAHASGFVYPSRWEACPAAVAEATSIGTPTLVTSYPMGRFLAQRGAALIVDSNPESLAAGLERLIGPEAAEIGRRGAEVARRDLSWDSVSLSWLERINELLGAST